MVVGSTRREGGAGDAHRLTSALLLKYTSERHPRGVVHLLRHLSPQRKRRTFIDLVARHPDSDFSLSAQAMCRSLVRPSDLDARSRAPHRSWGALALTSDRPPTHPPFFL